MNLKYITVAALILGVTYSQAIFAQESTAAQKVDQKSTEAAADAKAKALEEQLESELNKPAHSVIAPPAVTETTPAAEATHSPLPEDPLITQYKLRKHKNFKAVEFELAKELALSRSSASLDEQSEKLYSTATTSLSAVLGKISEPQKEETYFEYQENAETGEFVIILVKDSYVKSERGDVCQVGTQVHLRTSIQEEFTAKLSDLTPTVNVTTTPAPTPDDAAALAPAAPSTVTDIECYNEERPTYSQRVVN